MCVCEAEGGLSLSCVIEIDETLGKIERQGLRLIINRDHEVLGGRDENLTTHGVDHEEGVSSHSVINVCYHADRTKRQVNHLITNERALGVF